MKAGALFLLVGVLISTLHAGVGSAATIRVEKDGSGDFTVIQDAIGAAQDGDTILIGPGNYRHVTPYDLPPGPPIRAFVTVDKNDLTIRGTHRDDVVIGATVPNVEGQGPKGLAMRPNVTGLVVENLTVENTRDGFYLLGETHLSNVVARGNVYGVHASREGGITISDSVFELNDDGVFIRGDSSGAVLRHCTFSSSAGSVRFSSILYGVVFESSFVGGIIGVSFGSTPGTVAGCHFTDVLNASVTTGGVSSPVVEAHDNVIVGGMGGFWSSAGVLRGSGNSILGTTYAGILVSTGGSVVLSDNDIIPQAGHAARVDIQFVPMTLDIWNSPDYMDTSGGSFIAAS